MPGQRYLVEVKLNSIGVLGPGGPPAPPRGLADVLAVGMAFAGAR